MLIRCKFNFGPKEIIVIMDKIIEAFKNPMNDEFYIKHPVDWNAFTWKPEDGR